MKKKERFLDPADNITINLVEAASETISMKLAVLRLFNECPQESKIPEEKNEAIIRRGDPRDISNYRPIILLNNMYKLFTKVIKNRITSPLDRNQPREQAEFREGFPTTDHLHVVNQLIEKCKD